MEFSLCLYIYILYKVIFLVSLSNIFVLSLADSYIFFSIKVKNSGIDHPFESPDHYIFSVPANKLVGEND